MRSQHADYYARNDACIADALNPPSRLEHGDLRINAAGQPAINVLQEELAPHQHCRQSL